MKKFLALLIACLMIVTCFVACDTGDTTDNGNDGADQSADGGDKNTGDENTGDENTGDENTGDENTGDENTGDENTGDENTGDGNKPEVSAKEYYTGKSCVTFGDSITWYDGNAYNWGKEQGVVATGYQHYMEEELGLTIYNKGYSGQTMPQIMNNLKTFGDAFKSVDYLTIMSGANDERRNTPLGTIAAKGSTFDTTTYIGSLQSGIEYALSYNSDLEIVLFTPIVGWIYAPAGYAYDYDKANSPTVDGIITEKWADAVKEVAELYGLTVCDLYNDCEIQYEIADREAYMNDPEPPTNTLYSLHPNTAGYRKMADTIIATFTDMIK